MLSVECQIQLLPFLAKRVIPKLSKSDNQKQSDANLKSPTFLQTEAIWPIWTLSKNLMRHSFIEFPMRNFLGLQNENELRS